MYRTGDYAGALKAADAGAKANHYSEAWWRLNGEVLLTLGNYSEAEAALNQGVQYNSDSIRLRLLARQADLFAGKPDEAARQLSAISSIIQSRGRYERDPGFVTSLGEAALILGAEPKLVLENFLRLGQRATPPVRDAFLAIGKLAMDKHDYALAARTYQAGATAFPDDADMLYGLAAAHRASHDDEYGSFASAALGINPKHIPTLLLLAENLIDGEQYDNARDQLAKILALNPTEPTALALLSAMATLDNDTAKAAEYRDKALSTWKTNPQVDYLIGKKLAENYRFIQAASAETSALKFDDKNTPARVELAQDLLRMGLESQGWEMATRAHTDDAYDIEAFNLTTLHDQLDKFTTITSPHFNIRMAQTEAPVYGDRVLSMLEDERTKMTAKYGLPLDLPTTVEIYPNPDDFAVRTFGMPDIGGFLGVTFGPVVTINSPASSGANWKDVLWHEFVHVITLTMTRNRMPRWLSEGISVYEEQLADPAWGMKMSLDYHDRILDGKMQPISGMSAAFIKAKSSADMQFAYYESSLVVQFLIERYGFDRLKAVLHDLGAGKNMNESLAANLAPLDKLDTQFAEYARDRATKTFAGLDFTRPKPPTDENTPAPPPNPNNYYDRLAQIRALADKEEWTAVRQQLQELTTKGFYVPGAQNPYLLLAAACAKLNDTAGEKAALTAVAEHEGDSLNTVTRLLDIAQVEQDWPAVHRWSEAWLAINPLAPTPWRQLLAANEHNGDAKAAIEAGNALLQLDPPDAPDVHYRLARQLQPSDVEAARRQVLQALEDAPRFRAAYELLAALPPAPAPAPAVPAATPPATPVTNTP